MTISALVGVVFGIGWSASPDPSMVPAWRHATQDSSPVPEAIDSITERKCSISEINDIEGSVTTHLLMNDARESGGADCLLILSRTYENAGYLAHAEALARLALERAKSSFGSGSLDIIRFLHRHAICLMHDGDTRGAELQLLKARRISERADSEATNEQILALTGLATLSLWRQRLHEARRLASLAISKSDEPALEWEPVLILAEIARLEGRYADAEAHGWRALSLAEESLGDEGLETMRTLHTIGHVFFQQGYYADAREAFSRAVRIGTTHDLDNLDITCAMEELSWISWFDGRAEDAFRLRKRSLELEDQHLFKGLAYANEDQRLAYWSRYIDSTDSIISFGTNTARGDARFNRLTVETILRRKGLVQDLQARSRWTELTRSHQTPERDSTTPEVPDLSTTESWFPLHLPNLQLVPRISAADLEKVQQAMPEETVLLEFMKYLSFRDGRSTTKVAHHETIEERTPEARYGVAVLSGSRATWMDLGRADEIEDAVARFRRTVVRQGEVRWLGRELFDSLLRRPLVWAGEDVSRLLITPDDALSALPFGALHDGSEYVLEKWDVHYASAGRDLVRSRPRGVGRENGVVAMGNPSGIHLGGVDGELKEIERLFGDLTVLKGSLATKGNLLENRRPWILHIATHGFSTSGIGLESDGDLSDDGAPEMINRHGGVWHRKRSLLESGIAVAAPGSRVEPGGMMTSLEIARWDLRGTRLAVLSACDGGLGPIVRGEGVLGLRRAFVIAGTETQIVSLWKVSDESTAHLMGEYYSRLLDGEGRGAALRAVQLSMLESREFSSPYHWAGFVASGSWDPVVYGEQSVDSMLPVVPSPGCVIARRGEDGSGPLWMIVLAARSAGSCRRRRRSKYG